MLTAEEKALALARIDADQIVRTHGRKEPTTFRLIWKSFNINVGISAPTPLRTLLCRSDDLVHAVLSDGKYFIPRTQSLHAHGDRYTCVDSLIMCSKGNRPC